MSRKKLRHLCKDCLNLSQSPFGGVYKAVHMGSVIAIIEGTKAVPVKGIDEAELHLHLLGDNIFDYPYQSGQAPFEQ